MTKKIRVKDEIFGYKAFCKYCKPNDPCFACEIENTLERKK